MAASPGVVVGLAHVVDRRRVHVPRRHVSKHEIEGEVKRFRVATRRALEDLEGIKGRLPHGEHRQILKAQQLMLRDPDLVQDVETRIREDGRNAEWAVAQSTDAVCETLSKASDARFRERQFDVTFIAERLLRTLRDEHPGEVAPPAGCLVIAYDLSPADMAQMHDHGVAGLVTEIGGQTSHTAIMARALEIPAVAGVEGLIDQVKTGDLVVVDAVHGVVIVRPTEHEAGVFRGEARRYRAFEDRVQKEHGLLATTEDGFHVALRANVALNEDLESAVFHGAEGVGLYRTEYIYLNRSDPPSEEEHYQIAKSALQRCAPYPVTFRTFDLGSDKPCELFAHAHDEANPAMGLRSLRLALREENHFLAQLRGLLRAALHGPARIMLPLVGSLDELQTGLAMINEARSQLEHARVAHAGEVPTGIMIEVPSAALIADVLVQHVDFMSIGTNDLIQYTLAIDRENDEVNYLYQPLHPAILRLLRMVCEAGVRYDVPVSICGEMAADPLFTWVLMGLGLREFSVNPAAVPVLKNLIRATTMADAERMVREVDKTPTAQGAEAIVLAEMRERFPEHLLHGAGASSATAG
ncbi:MAG: phosphoenolpyruvate--protein phosphotransferase [Nannocystaceae bacterium]